MISLKDGRELLHHARTQEGLLHCAQAFGFSIFTEVGADLQQKLGIAELGRSFVIGDGRKLLRALLVHLPSRAQPREALHAIARALSSSVPHLLWIVFSRSCDGHVGISVWRSDSARIRTQALLAETNRITDSDAHTICALIAGRSESESITHLRWTEILGREVVTIRFFRALRSVIDNLTKSIHETVPGKQAEDLSLVCVSRLLFLSFVETKGWLNGDHDFLANTFIQCVTAGGSYHRKVLSPLFFGTLNTPVARRAGRARDFGRVPFLNGGLFARTPAERALQFEFSDEALGSVFGEVLTRFRFTGREHSFEFSESAIDPEILGRAFESLMQRESRKATGAFYTPQPIVHRVANAALECALGSSLPAEAVKPLFTGESLPEHHAPEALRLLKELRIVDPACGSGAFLVYLLEKIAEMRRQCGDSRPAGDRRREVLAASIFGVDINPTAVWLCELRLWLSVVIHAQSGTGSIVPLPNLDRNIRVGDSLGVRRTVRPGVLPSADVERVRLRYVRAVGAKKKLLARSLERLERKSATTLLQLDLAAITIERKDLLSVIRSRNLFGERAGNAIHRARLRDLRTRKTDSFRELSQLKKGGALPFSFETHFSDVFESGGFDLVVGNPPWVRIHQISKGARDQFRSHFELCKSKGWSLGATRAHAGSGFANQLDLSALFVERGIGITRENGCVALLLPAKLWKSLAGGSVRALVTRACVLRTLEDFSGAKAMFDATTYPSLLVASKRVIGADPAAARMTGVVHRHSQVLRWQMSPDMLSLDPSSGSPWLLVPPEVRAVFDRIGARGTALADTEFGRPILGVKTGLNEAFIVQADETRVEECLLRSVVKGDGLDPWKIRETGERIIWTHASDGHPNPRLPPLAAKWFYKWKKQLAARTDLRGEKMWWRVFRTEAADASVNRVVWSDIGRAPRAALLREGDEAIPLNTCYVVRCPSLADAKALTTLLNSPLVAAWLSLIAEPAQGGYKRYFGWTMAMVPIPRNWEKSKRGLADVYDRAIAEAAPCANELFHHAVRAYGLAADDIQDLMAWAAT